MDHETLVGKGPKVEPFNMDRLSLKFPLIDYNLAFTTRWIPFEGILDNPIMAVSLTMKLSRNQ